MPDVLREQFSRLPSFWLRKQRSAELLQRTGGLWVILRRGLCGRPDAGGDGAEGVEASGGELGARQVERREDGSLIEAHDGDGTGEHGFPLPMPEKTARSTLVMKSAAQRVDMEGDVGALVANDLGEGSGANGFGAVMGQEGEEPMADDLSGEKGDQFKVQSLGAANLGEKSVAPVRLKCGGLQAFEQYPEPAGVRLFFGDEQIDGAAVGGVASLCGKALEMLALATFAQVETLQSANKSGTLQWGEHVAARLVERQAAFARGVVLVVGDPVCRGRGRRWKGGHGRSSP